MASISVWVVLLFLQLFRIISNDFILFSGFNEAATNMDKVFPCANWKTFASEVSLFSKSFVIFLTTCWERHDILDHISYINISFPTKCHPTSITECFCIILFFICLRRPTTCVFSASLVVFLWENMIE